MLPLNSRLHAYVNHMLISEVKTNKEMKGNTPSESVWYHPRNICAKFIVAIVIIYFSHESQETLIHLFWACPVTALFWEHLTKWLERVKLIQETYTLVDITALGLRLDSSKFSI